MSELSFKGVKVFTLFVMLLVSGICVMTGACNYEDDFIQESLLSDGPNADEPLQFDSYLGNNENIHPKVLYFENGWNGYKYWMAYTPYPKGALAAENPCIASSNDGVNWETPAGLINPLFPEFEDGYNSDTHLVYREDDDVLECWWRPHDQTHHMVYVCRRTSEDGINWTKTEKMLESSDEIKAILSPAVSYGGSNYTMYYSDGIDIFEIHCVADGKFEWSHPEKLPIVKDNLCFWHHDVIEYEPGVREFVICAFEVGRSHNEADLYYVRYDAADDQYSKPIKILARSEDPKAFDARSIYRASILRVDGKYMIYYSSIDFSRHRHMALSVGDSPFSLRGYNPSLSAIEEVEDWHNGLSVVDGHKIVSTHLPFSVWGLAGQLIGTSTSAGGKHEFSAELPGVVVVRTPGRSYKIIVK